MHACWSDRLPVGAPTPVHVPESGGFRAPPRSRPYPNLIARPNQDAMCRNQTVGFPIRIRFPMSLSVACGHAIVPRPVFRVGHRDGRTTSSSCSIQRPDPGVCWPGSGRGSRLLGDPLVNSALAGPSATSPGARGAAAIYLPRWRPRLSQRRGPGRPPTSGNSSRQDSTDVRLDGLGNVIGERKGRAYPPQRGDQRAIRTPCSRKGTERHDLTRRQRPQGPRYWRRSSRISEYISASSSPVGDGGVRTGGTLTFVATLGEEGLGDLRGA